MSQAAQMPGQAVHSMDPLVDHSAEQMAEQTAEQTVGKPTEQTTERPAPKFPPKPFTSSLDAFGNPSPSVMFGSSVEEAKASSRSVQCDSPIGHNHPTQASAQPMQPAVGYFPDPSYYAFAPFSSMFSDYSNLGAAPGMQAAPQAQREEASATQVPTEERYSTEATNNYMSYQVGVLLGDNA